MYWWIIRILVYDWNKLCVYLCDGDTKEYIMVGLGNSVSRTWTSSVGLKCLTHLATLVVVHRSSKGSYLKYYLVIFCMYVFRRFHPQLRRGDTSGAHNLLRLRREIFQGSYSRVRYKFMCYVLYMFWLVCVGSHIFVRSSAGQYSWLPWMGLRSFFPVYGRWYNRSLLCLTFTFVYFSVGFIWKNGSNVVSSLLVRAILPFVINFSRKLVGLKVCCSFLFDVILLVVVMILMLHFSQYW